MNAKWNPAVFAIGLQMGGDVAVGIYAQVAIA